MLKKLIAGGLTAAVAAVAVLLVTAAGTSTVTAAVNGISATPSTVNAGGASTITIDADEDAGTVASPGAGDVRVIATGGDFTAAVCDSSTIAAAAPAACDVDVPTAAGTFDGAAIALAAGGALDTDIEIDDDPATPDAGAPVDAANTTGVDTIVLTWAAPAQGPASVTVTAVQGTSSKSIGLTVRGNAATVEVSALAAAPAAGATCPGTTANVINSTTATAANGGLAAAALCTLVKDSAGNRLTAQPVIYSTTAGTVAPLTDITGATGTSAVASALTAGATGVSGATATVTATSGGQSATVDVKFGGDPASCSISSDPTTVAPGGSALLTISVMDSSGGPVADGVTVAAAQANASVGGAGAAVVGAASPALNGASQATIIAATEGPVAVGASSPVAAAGTTTPVTCTQTVLVQGSVVPPGGGTTTPPAGGTITGATLTPGQLSIGTGNGSLVDLGASAVSQGCTNPVLWLNNPSGGLIGFFPTATLSAPNVAANAAFGTSGYNGGILVDCN